MIKKCKGIDATSKMSLRKNIFEHTCFGPEPSLHESHNVRKQNQLCFEVMGL